jgi:hypothetical protein
MPVPLASPFTRVRASVREEAATRWGIRNGRLVEALAIMPFVGAAVVIVSWADRPLFHLLTDDDRILEWLQFVGYVAATLLGAAIALQLWRRRNRPMAGLYCLFTLGCLFIAGEEVSWGQRIFGWGTPEPLERINHQRETTLHNIGTIHGALNVVMLLIGLIGFVAPWLVLRYGDRLPGDIVRFVVPPLFVSSAFFMVFAYKIIRFTLFPDPQSATVSFGEWPEFCLAYALSSFALLERLRLRVAAPPAEVAPAARPADVPPAQTAPGGRPMTATSPGASRRARHRRSSAA